MFGKAIPNLPARDLDATAAMYARIGFERANRHDGYLIVEREDAELHFFASPELDPGTTAGMAYLRVVDVDAFHAEVVAVGFEVLGPDELHERWANGGPLERISAVEDKPWGLRQFALFDVDNNLLQIGQPLGR
jgi:hypothetical protein